MQPRNTILYGVFPCKKDDHDALSRMAAVYVPDIDALRTGGVEVSGERRAVRLILLGDYCFITLWCGHMGASSRMPCVYCTAMRCRTARNGSLVDQYGDMQAGSKARGTLRTRQHMEEMAAAYQDGGNASRGTPLSLKEHLSIERRPCSSSTQAIYLQCLCIWFWVSLYGSSVWGLRLYTLQRAGVRAHVR